VPERQAAWCCSLPGFDRRAWAPDDLVQIHLGAPPRYDDGCDDLEPLEPIEADGCPGGWYRTPFVESVLRYARRPAGDGGRVPNRLLDLCDDELVIEAVERLEAHEDQWRNARENAQIERHNAEIAAMQAVR
jgi:hypothetical protein